MSSRNSDSTGLVWLALIGLILFAIGMVNIGLHASTSDLTATVTHHERVTTGSGDQQSSKYLVFTDREVLKDVDSIFFFKFGSSDVYGRITDGKTYQFRVYGWRVPFLSWYRNIIQIKEVS